jgi:hypothetical protein
MSRIYGLRFTVYDLGFGQQGFGLKGKGSGFVVECIRVEGEGSGCRAWGYR